VGFDYSQAGAYFVTICTHARELSLQVDSVRKAVHSAWDGLLLRFPGVTTDEFIIMPNHIHGIVVLEGGGAASSAPTLGRVIRAFKSISGIGNRILGRANWPFWQRGTTSVIRRTGTACHPPYIRTIR
jgi:REP element-mobilizing transposase RayT